MSGLGLALGMIDGESSIHALPGFGADRVRMLDLPNPATRAAEMRRRRASSGSGDTPVSNILEPDADTEATLSDYGKVARAIVDEHSKAQQEWVVSSVRAMRRSFRKRLEAARLPDHMLPALMEDMAPLLQLICDETAWMHNSTQTAELLQVRHPFICSPFRKLTIRALAAARVREVYC
jgi:hypothetical protein